jgi:hypothetical protein
MAEGLSMAGRAQRARKRLRIGKKLGHQAKDGMEDAADTAEEVSDTKTLDVVARTGFAVVGLLHVLIGALAIRIALGSPAEADQAGAVEALAVLPGGPLLMWAGFAGCLGLALWQLSEASLRSRHLDGRHRLSKTISSGSLSVAYAGIALLFASFNFSRHPDSGTATRDFTAALMQAPAGVPLLVGLGAGVLVIGGYFVDKGARKKFKDELQLEGTTADALITGLGVAGHIAKGVALGLVGLLFIIAALQHTPAESTGLDGSLKALPEHPFGVYALLAIGLGLVCYGVFAIVRAKYGRM